MPQRKHRSSKEEGREAFRLLVANSWRLPVEVYDPLYTFIRDAIPGLPSEEAIARDRNKRLASRAADPAGGGRGRSNGKGGG